MLCVARPELLDAPDWPGEAARDRTSELEALQAADVDALLTALERRRPPDDARAHRRGRRRQPALPGADGRCAGRRRRRLVPRPASIQALLAARLDRLAAGERSTLERAAVAGKEFRPRRRHGALTRRGRPAVASRLLALVRRGLLEPARRTGADDDVLRFRHVLIRDAAYAAAPKELRADLHERFAGWLERNAGETQVDELIGYHLEQSFRAARAARPARRRGPRLVAERAGGPARPRGPARLRPRRHAGSRRPPRSRGGAPPDQAIRRRLRRLSRRRHRRSWEAGRADDALEALTRLLAEAEATGEARLVALAHLERIVHEQLTGADVSRSAGGCRARDRAVRGGRRRRGGLALAWRRFSRPTAVSASSPPPRSACARQLDHARAAGNRHEEARAVDGLCNCLLYGPTPVQVRRSRPARELLDSVGRNANAGGECARRALPDCEAMRRRLRRRAGAPIARAAAILEELGLELAASCADTESVFPVELLAGRPRRGRARGAPRSRDVRAVRLGGHPSAADRRGARGAGPS